MAMTDNRHTRGQHGRRGRGAQHQTVARQACDQCNRPIWQVFNFVYTRATVGLCLSIQYTRYATYNLLLPDQVSKKRIKTV